MTFPTFRVFTGTTSSSMSVIYAQSSQFVGFDANKYFRFRCLAKLSHSINQNGRFGIGSLGGGDVFLVLVFDLLMV